jgi:hypothetical protein
MERLVLKGLSENQGIHLDEIFSPVVKMSTIWHVLGLLATLDLEIKQLDMKTTCFYWLGGIMEQLEGFKVASREHLVCKLNKKLYGLKKAPQKWYK